MRDNKIKAMIKEAIEEDRKAHNKIQINRFLVGLTGALFFFWGLCGVILLITLFGINNFISGSFIGLIIGVDIWLIAHLARWIK
jgi:hypothetical protein